MTYPTIKTKQKTITTTPKYKFRSTNKRTYKFASPYERTYEQTYKRTFDFGSINKCSYKFGRTYKPTYKRSYKFWSTYKSLQLCFLPRASTSRREGLCSTPGVITELIPSQGGWCPWCKIDWWSCLLIEGNLKKGYIYIYIYLFISYKF